MSKRARLVVSLLAVGGAGLAAAAVYAMSASSPAYRLIETPAVTKGFASSASYKLYASTGQPAPVGVGSSATYKHHAGFIRRLFQDTDLDTFKDSREAYLGTDLLDACPNNSTHAAYPPDFTNDTRVNIVDMGTLIQHFGKDNTMPDWAQHQRYDLTGDGRVNIVDMGTEISYFGRDCTN